MIKSDLPKEVVYVHPHFYTFGELIGQVFWLRNIYDTSEFQLTLITYPLQKQRLNRSVYNIVSRGINVVHSTDHKLIWFSSDHNRQSMIEDNERIYAIFSNAELRNRFWMTYQNKMPDYFHTLNKYEFEMGGKIRKKFGIPDPAPIVTLHVRDSGWYGRHDQGWYCNATIENYFPAIHYLIDNGFYVVRLGDKNMKPLKNPPRQLIDAPFHPAYTELVDPYFTAISEFFIGLASGGNALADSFGIPKLYVNFLIHPYMAVYENDLCLFKRYYSRQLKRDLTFEEILLSNIVYEDLSSLPKHEIDLIENTPDEILMAVKEMHSRIMGSYSYDEVVKTINRRIQEIQSKARTLHSIHTHAPVYNLARADSVLISTEFIKANPMFLGHHLSKA